MEIFFDSMLKKMNTICIILNYLGICSKYYVPHVDKVCNSNFVFLDANFSFLIEERLLIPFCSAGEKFNQLCQSVAEAVV